MVERHGGTYIEQTLGKRIMENRKRLKLTQEQLAEMLGVTAQAVSKWENDQSCPDIAMLPKLADIFGISTDVLLGHLNEDKCFEGEVVEEEEQENDGIHLQNGNWEFKWNSKKSHSIGLAVFVLTVGVLYLLSQIFRWNLSLWDVSWPTAILIFGLWGLLQRFSFFHLGCTLFGGYALADKLFNLSINVDGKVIWGVLILLFGVSLLVDAMKKNHKPIISINAPSHKINYNYTEDTFTFANSFGEHNQQVLINTLRHGQINVSFGEYILDLTNIENIISDCHIDVKCSFGELILKIPKQYQVITDISTAFSELAISGSPNEHPTGVIHLNGSISFGEVTITYI